MAIIMTLSCVLSLLIWVFMAKPVIGSLQSTIHSQCHQHGHCPFLILSLWIIHTSHTSAIIIRCPWCKKLSSCMNIDPVIKLNPIEFITLWNQQLSSLKILLVQKEYLLTNQFFLGWQPDHHWYNMFPYDNL